MNKLLKQLILFVKGFFLMNMIWFSASVLTETTVIPNPLVVYKNIERILQSNIHVHILNSLYRIGMGLLLSLIVGIPIGILMAYSHKANKVLYPLIYFSYPIPKTSLLPVAMLLLGMRDGSKIAIMFLVIVFQVIVSVRDSINNIEPVMYQVLKSVGANKIQIIKHVTLPGILPNLLTTARVSTATAVSILFFVEGYGTKYGIGYYILDAWSRINYIDMYIGIIVISIIGFGMFAIIDLLSDLICKWNN